MFHVGPGELVVILLLALIIFGPGKLPEVGRALGRTINEFRRVTRQVEEDMTAEPRRPERAGSGEPAGSGTSPAASPPSSEPGSAAVGGGSAGHAR